MRLIRSAFSTPPICAITLAGRPDISQAWIARRRGSAPCLKITFSDILTLAPSTKSGFSAMARAQASTWAWSML